MTEQTILACCRYHFTDAERLQIAEELAAALITKDTALRNFVIAKKAHEENIAKQDAHIRALSRQLCEGWEFRDLPCRELPNNPTPGEKTVMRVDTGEEISVERMSEKESQFHLSNLPVEEPNDRFAEKEGARQEVSSVNV